MTANMEKLHSKAITSLAVLFILSVQASAFSLTNCTVSGALNDTRVLKVLCYKMGFFTVPSPIPSKVRHLDISFNSISNIKLSDFEDLWNLRSLNLSDSHVSWIEDGTAEHFPNLTYLNLANNKLKNVSRGLLHGLGHLQVLRLDRNMIESIDTYAFDTLQNLRMLNLTRNNLRKITSVRPVLSSPGLEELYIASNNFEVFNSWDLSRTPLSLKTLILTNNPLTKFQITDNIFPNLDYLDLSHCGQSRTMLWNLTDKTFLSSVKTLNLTGVRIPQENIAAVLHNISWTSLFKLKLNELKQVNVETLLAYACLPGLSVLRMQRNRISNLTTQMLEPCSNLTELDFGLNEISRISAPIFKAVTQLRVLRLHINKLTQVNNLFRNLPMLEFIDLSRNQISTLTCSDFANLTRLNSLYLFSNRISKLPSCVFKDLNNLEILRLGTNKLLTIGGVFKNNLPFLKVLELEFNKLSIIYNETFRGLSGLQTLRLGDNQISKIEAEAFFGLRNLTSLLLFSNRITDKTIQDQMVFSHMLSLISLELHCNVISYTSDTLKTPPFEHLSSLEILTIHSQRRGFGKIPSNLLQGLTSLKMFYGGNMNLNRLHPDTFNSTPMLWFLDLSKNAFAEDDSITAEVFHPVPKLTKLIIARAQIHSLNFLVKANLSRLSALRASGNMLDVINQTLIRSFTHLRYLDLQKNTFTCDCNNAYFIKWAVDSNSTQVIYLNDYTCSYPLSQKGKSILDLNIDLCIVNISFMMFVCSSVVVSLTLLISFVYQFLRWQVLYAYHLFVAFLYDSKQKRMHQQQGYKYDAFISYNARDEAWVIDELLPHLEGEQGWRLCLHHRDFEPGRPIIDNIMDGIYSSRKTVCLITYDYLMSTWCSKEIQMATFRLFDEQKDVLILIFLEDIPSHQLSPFYRMRKLVKKKTYLKWPKHGEDTRVFWQKLRMALETKEGPEEEKALLSGQEESHY
ncbi:toll-like receptor 22 [Tachysurus fulvidraco]|uniref:toll-like receptor 22 n=1 Tax=Tachysurus fulvidraco TaxID=1234273 RepID=UPI001FEE4724|nr:toll-like receptor 22 [Tachysurus fulvidraco]XP_047661506.1 toll-like receptor 22 [Tachysurus fulvidraco]XP_047661507.1 toll-like receptor 22 [Tachysurus fulvidraco]